MIYEFINRTEDFMQSLLHQGSSAPRSLKKFFIYSMSTLKTNRTASFTFYQFFSLTLIGEQGMAQWWELSPPSSTQPDVYGIYGLSLLLVLSLPPRGCFFFLFFFSEMPGAITMHSLVFRVQVSQFHATFQKLFYLLGMISQSLPVSRTIKGFLSAKNIGHLRKSIGCFVLSRKRDLS